MFQFFVFPLNWFQGCLASLRDGDPAPAPALASHNPEAHEESVDSGAPSGHVVEEELEDLPLASDHCLTDLPKSRNFPDAEEPKEPLERVACDHVISRTSLGNGGETCSFVILDRYSGLVGVTPCKSKSSEEVEDAFRRSSGRRKIGIVSAGTGRVPEILSALKRLGFNSEPAEPRQTLQNPYAESFIRTLKGMASSLLLQAGLGHEFWPAAHSTWNGHILQLPCPKEMNPSHVSSVTMDTHTRGTRFLLVLLSGFWI